MKLRLKQELFWELHDDVITVFSSNTDLKREIIVEKPKEFFDFLNYMKEPKTKHELLHFKDLSTSEIESILDFLLNKKYVEPELDLPDYETRFLRYVSTYPNVNLSDLYSNVKSKKILILGLGTGGSYQIEVLHKIGLRNFTLVDGDKVEAENLAAQNYTMTDVGQYKTNALKKHYNDKEINIEVFTKYLSGYKELEKLTDLSSYDYIINCCDDKKFTLDLLSNLFEAYPNSKVILNGYTVLRQVSFLVTKDTYKKNVFELKRYLDKNISQNNIAINSGSIFNAFFLAFSVGKIIFDDIFDVAVTDYAYLDLLENNFFIGNSFEWNEYKGFRDQKNKVNNQVKKRSNGSNDSGWLVKVTKKNILQDNVIKKPIVSVDYLPFLYSAPNFNYFNHCFEIKKDFADAKYYEIPFSEVKPFLMDYIKHNFSTNIANDVKNAFEQNRIFTDKSRYSQYRSFTTKTDTGVTLIYSVSDKDQKYYSTNQLIHEIFHLVFFNFSNNSVEHESFVTEQQTKFMLHNIGNNKLRKLAANYLLMTSGMYLGTVVTNQYERYSYLKNIEQYAEDFPTILKDENEFLKVMDINIDYNHFLSKAKYEIAVNKNIYALKELEGLLKSIN